MKKFIAVIFALLLMSSSSWAGGGYTIESVSAGYTDIYNAANRTDEDITIKLKAFVKYYPYDTNTTIEFKNGIGTPIKSITVTTTDDDEIWSIEGEDLFKIAQTDGSTSMATQAAFFEGRTDSSKGPVFPGVKNEIIAAARKHGITLTGFGDEDSENTTITLNARSISDAVEDKIAGIKIVYDKEIASPSYSPTATISDRYGEADSVKFSVDDEDSVLTISYGDNPVELNGTKVYETQLTCRPSGEGGTINITAELVDADEDIVPIGDKAVVKMSSSFDVHSEPGSDSGTQVINDGVNLNVSNLAGTSSDPERTNWDGIDLSADTAGTGTADKLKIASISKTTFTAGSYEDQPAVITIKGAAPNAWVYIAKKDAAKLFPDEDGEGPDENIYLTQENIIQYGIPFRVTSFDAGANTKNAESKLTITFNGAKTAIKAFPLTVAVQNASMKSPVTKTFKLNANPSASISWRTESADEYGDKFSIGTKGTYELVIPLSEDTAVDWRESLAVPTLPIFTVSGDGHYTIAVKPEEKNGIEAEIIPPEFDAFGGVKTPGSVNFTGSLEIENKESKTAFTITATNTSTKKKVALKVNVVGKMGPNIKNKTGEEDDSGLMRIDPKTTRRVEAGKVPGITLKAIGSKTISWLLGDDDEYLEEDTIYEGKYYAELLADVGLSFDKKTGKIKALTNAKNITPTVNYEGEFESLDIVVHATNGYGPGDWARMWVAVTGAKPTLNTTKLTLSRDAFKSGDIAAVLTAKTGKTVITSADTKGANIKFSALNKKNTSEDTKALADLGLELVTFENNSEYRNYGVLRVLDGGLKSTKGKKVSLKLDNWGATNIGNLTIIINDPAPVVETDCASDDGVYYAVLSGSKTAAATATVNLWISDETLPANDSTKFAWKVQKPKGSIVNAAVKADSSSKGQKAVLTFTLPKNKLTAAQNDFVVQATNSINKKSGTLTIRVKANQPASTSETTDTTTKNNSVSSVTALEAFADYEADEWTEAESESEEAGVVFGDVRDYSSLTEGQKAFIESKGYIVVAVLPEVVSDTDGQQEMIAELNDDAVDGAKLIYLPFPNEPEVEDDSIADFYDEAGAPIDEVPEGRVITVDAWLRSGVTYQPVIAIEK